MTLVIRPEAGSDLIEGTEYCARGGRLRVDFNSSNNKEPKASLSSSHVFVHLPRPSAFPFLIRPAIP